MFCSKCGKEIPNDSTFCSGCGNSVNGSVSSAPVQQTVYVNQTKSSGIAGAPDEVGKKKIVLGLYILGGSILLLFFIDFIAENLLISPRKCL